MDLKELLAEELENVRRRSLNLLDPIPDHEQLRVQSPIMSPLAWDLGHVGSYEELWLLRSLAGVQSISSAYDDLYNPVLHPRSERPKLKLLAPPDARSYLGDVRSRTLDLLERIELDPDNPLLADGFIYALVLQHEHQHDETMLATLQLMRERSSAPPGTTSPPRGAPLEHVEVFVSGGAFSMGTSLDPWALDNERPGHSVEIDPFWIDSAPVTNGSYIEFIGSGGYDDPRWWTEAGWQWRVEARLEHPEFWERAGETWTRMQFGTVSEVPLDEPVQHVCWYEADAYARWAGRRLPTEKEWEMAAAHSPDGHKRRWPWGDSPPRLEHANLGQRHPGPAPVGAYPAGISACGAHQMIGDVWEWTSSDFTAYPGTVAFPYREYSEVFYGNEYKVLRGGSWATHPLAMRNTFRNWDFPIRRQIFAGFRCARDA